jgi:hypothetical protein
MALLRNTVSRIPDNETKLLIVAGDNYYPDKRVIGDKKVAYITDSDLMSGFECLPDIPTKVLLGNHDLETNKRGKDKLRITNDEHIENDCHILKSEKRAVSNKGPLFDFNIFFYKIVGKVLIIGIDSSMYDCEDVENMLQCYRHMNEHEESIRWETKEDLFRWQTHKVIAALHNLEEYPEISKILVVAHHPITALKKKKRELKTIKYYDEYVKLLDIVHIHSFQREIVLLCGDQHLFQKGQVKIENIEKHYHFTIKQIISGTGGTELDPNPLINHSIENFPIIESSECNDSECISGFVSQYTISYELSKPDFILAKRTHSQHGFLHCKISDNELSIYFHSISYRDKIPILTLQLLPNAISIGDFTPFSKVRKISKKSKVLTRQGGTIRRRLRRKTQKQHYTRKMKKRKNIQ